MMNPEIIRRVLSLEFPPAAQQRMETLCRRAQAGALNEAERAELDSYREVRDLLAHMQESARHAQNGKEAADDGLELAVPPGIRRSQEAFWRDLPALLQDRRNHGQWVAYHGDERIGIARTGRELIQECIRRGLQDDEFDLGVIEPRDLPPWEPEEIEGGGHDVDEEETWEQPDSTGAPP